MFYTVDQNALNECAEAQSKIPITDSIELLVLKGHLFIERELNALIELAVMRPEKLEPYPQAFNFAAKVVLVESLYDFRNNDGLFNIIRTLNKIRNRYAHDLEPSEISTLVKKMSSAIVAIEPQLKNEIDSYAGNEVKCLELFIGYISGVLGRIRTDKKANG